MRTNTIYYSKYCISIRNFIQTLQISGDVIGLYVFLSIFFVLSTVVKYHVLLNTFYSDEIQSIQRRTQYKEENLLELSQWNSKKNIRPNT